MYSSRPSCTKCSQFLDVFERSTTFFRPFVKERKKLYLYTSNFFYSSIKISWVVYELNKKIFTFLASDISKGLFTWSGGPRSSGVGFFCFHALEDTKQKKLTPLDRGPLLHVNRP